MTEAPPPYRYSIEGEFLTKAEIVKRVAALAPSVPADTVRKRIDRQGARTWHALTLPTIDGAKLRAAKGKATLDRSMRRPGGFSVPKKFK